MQLSPFPRWRAIPALLLALALGCAPAREPLVSVRGTIRYRGIPLPCGTIVFTPDRLRGTQGPLARAAIEADGTYVLRTSEALGAVAGWHRVTVAAVQLPPLAPPGQRFVQLRPLVPEKYRDPDLSGLACEVRAGQANHFDWNLE